jgi:Tfp pilus assembly protein PilN
MRPVNLIPPEDRRGDSAPSRTGVLSYAIVGFLVVAVAVVAWSALLGGKIDDKKAEIASLEAEVSQSQARADALAPYVSLAQVREARSTTIDSLAKSRFDWERVLRELARVTPDTISLTGVTGTVSPAVAVDSGATVTLRSQIPGPALEVVGCATSQRKLAEYISSLHDIDGVTRVAASTGVRGSKEDDGASSTDAGGGCPKPSDSAFQIAVAFDEVAVPAAAAAPVTPAPTTTATATSTATTDGGVSAEQTQQDQNQAAVSNAAQKSQDATNIVPKG